MTRIFTLFVLMVVSISISAQRYVDEVFTDVDVETDIMYGANIEVLTGAPVLVNLPLDVYTPAGDTATNRPLIIVFHTGNFLPPFVNGSIHGVKDDPYLVDMIQRLARRGYVVASADYRLGWNPISPEQDVRTETLINAAYRGVQDAHTATRFFRKSIEEGNPYGINGEDVVLWGVGTGGYITLAAGTIDEYNDIVLDKFINSEQVPMVLEALNGDPFGEAEAIINVPNHVGYSNDISMTVNVGGALGDTSWITANDAPIISYHVPTDPYAPYETDILIVPTTGDLVVEVSGSYDLQAKANEFGINDVFNAGVYTDVYSTTANARNDGNIGLFPFPRPSWDLDGDPATPPIEEGSPWVYWDAAFWSTQQPQQCIDQGIPLDLCNWDLVSRQDNPDASFAKADAYMDSIVNYFVPRACVTLDLEECAGIYTGTKEVNLDASVISVSPNPAAEYVMINSGEMTMNKVAVYGMNGQLYGLHNVNGSQYRLQKNNLPSGIYFVKAIFDEGIATQRVVFK